MNNKIDKFAMCTLMYIGFFTAFFTILEIVLNEYCTNTLTVANISLLVSLVGAAIVTYFLCKE